jgi:hypothetical protein
MEIGSMHTIHQKRTVTAIKAAVVLLFAHLVAPCLYADVISFTGNLQTDATVLPPFSSPTVVDYAQWAAVVLDFHVNSESSMKAMTFSYGGGTNGNGMLIAPNGFEPYLSLFDAGGDFIASTFFGTTCPAGAQTNPDTGFCFDVALDGGILAAGDYKIAISAFENMSFAENFGSGTLADGFTGLGNLAEGEDLHYAFDVILAPATVAPVPEPSTFLPVAGGIVSCWVGLVSGRKAGRRRTSLFRRFRSSR